MADPDVPAHPTGIHVDDVSKRYGRHVAVSRLTFAVEPGQICALLGPNGAGKASTLRMLTGLATPDTGRVSIAGLPVTLGAAVLRHVGVVIDGPAFVPHLTGTANLRLLWAAARQQWPPPDLDDALDLAGPGPAIDRRVSRYSTGMKQRLILAQALMRRPQVLILDEPATGLDPAEVRALRRQLADRAAAGATVLISSHQLAEVQQLAGHVVVMNHGHLVTAGRLDDLLARGGAATFRIRTDDPDQAVTVLRGTAGVITATNRGGDVVVACPTVPAHLVAALVQADVAVTGADPARQSLEDAYLAITEGRDHAAP